MITLNANVNRKIPGTEQYSSAGYSCSITAEVDDGALKEPDKLQKKIEYLYTQCKDAIEKQISGGGSRTQSKPANNRTNSRWKRSGNNGSKNNGSGSKGANGSNARSQKQDNAQRMTPKQRSFIEKLAREANVNGTKLEALTAQMFNSEFNLLSKMDASSLVSTLKDVKEGTLQLADL